MATAKRAPRRPAATRSRAKPAPPAASKATAADAFAAARAAFAAGERIDMQALAKELGVSRDTLYRWTGGRQQLLADVLWSFAAELAGRTRVAGRGPEAIVQSVHALMTALAAFEPLRAILASEHELATRILTRPGLGVHERAVAALAGEFDAIAAASGWSPRLGSETLAIAILRIIEGFLYDDIVEGTVPDVERATTVVRALL